MKYATYRLCTGHIATIKRYNDGHYYIKIQGEMTSFKRTSKKELERIVEGNEVNLKDFTEELTAEPVNETENWVWIKNQIEKDCIETIEKATTCAFDGKPLDNLQIIVRETLDKYGEDDSIPALKRLHDLQANIDYCYRETAMGNYIYDASDCRNITEELYREFISNDDKDFYRFLYGEDSYLYQTYYA